MSHTLDPLFAWLEATSFSTWMRESPSMFAFPLFLVFHAIGMGLAVGVNVAVALRVLDAGRGVAIAEMRRFVPFMWFGFWLNAASGVALLLGYPTKALTNPVFYLKLGLIGAALRLAHAIVRRASAGGAADAGRAPVGLTGLAVASLACWFGAVTAGRLLAYTYTRLTSAE